MKKSSGNKFDGEERRRDRRRPIIESFSFFITFPGKGHTKLPIQDISEVGVAYSAEVILGFKAGEIVECDLFLNQSLSIPLSGKVVRVIGSKQDLEIQEIALEFHDHKHKGVIALTKFLVLLDSLSEIAHVES